jgi:regulation of enolase protein 1 (concanavalin A-like superfamily)
VRLKRLPLGCQHRVKWRVEDNRMTTFTLPSVPGEFQWKNQPLAWEVGADGSLTIQAGEHTNWFIDPTGNYARDSAPGVLFEPPDASFIVSAKVTVDFMTNFDAGVLQLRENDERWAKLCFEYSPQGHPMVVSVVTRGTSDDCNSVVIEGREVYLRVALTPQTIAFHYSHDGAYWHLVRYFTLGKLENLRVGFAAQSPSGAQCTAVFSDIRYRAGY